METKLACLNDKKVVVNIAIASDNVENDKMNLIAAYNYSQIVVVDSNANCEIGNVYENNVFVDSADQKAAKQEALRVFLEEQQKLIKTNELANNS